ncbi:NUDIX domain-containing protein [Kibdelosporangium aridum]|uniref:NUDIX domain-containing protein n=1 Tax=Kibdelosporangium aridum TaxID=2030 RepID=A0A428Z062_KIBAR|nr:NUDIX domain-containing protein [Kibdelosporangium aridum]RSM77321.1 NUDIX domain-containing protein [Kibdelosporangium aridum]
MKRDAYCSSCGTAYADTSGYPRVCSGCGMQTWANPTPVAIVLVPVKDGSRTGLLVVRRAIPPVGQLALVGGFVDQGETWQQAGARELCEEAGMLVDSATLQPMWFTSTEPDPRHVLLFSLALEMQASDLPPFTPNSEASERGVIFGPRGLAFSLHEEAALKYFGSDGPADFKPL